MADGWQLVAWTTRPAAEPQTLNPKPQTLIKPQTLNPKGPEKSLEGPKSPQNALNHQRLCNEPEVKIWDLTAGKQMKDYNEVEKARSR